MTEKITIETLVDAPVEAVWSAWTTPADIVAWNAASDDWHTTRAEADLRDAGALSPAEFDALRAVGEDLGFAHVQSSPLTRSSYHAREAAGSAQHGGPAPVPVALSLR